MDNSVRENSDYFIGNIEELTKSNTSYRKVLFTTAPQQLVLMNIKPGEEIGSEIHSDTTQFFRIETGKGIVVLGNDKKEFEIFDGMSVIVPPGIRHNIKNTGVDNLKLYTIYSPWHHPPNRLQQTKPKLESEPESSVIKGGYGIHIPHNQAMKFKYRTIKNDYDHIKKLI
jgi:mannose-6-phosphate isomerase-like protein (cupin superfamily)